MSMHITYDRVLAKLAEGASLEEVLESLALTGEEVRPHMLCSVLLLDDDGRHLLHASAPSLPEFYSEAINGLEIGPEVGSCGAAAFRKERVIAADLLQHPNWTPYRTLATKAGLRACWSQPIFSSGHDVLGTFAIYYREPREPDDDDLTFIETAAQLAGVAIELKQSEEALRDAHRELESRVEERTAELAEANRMLEDKRSLLQTLIDLLPSRVFVKDTNSRFLLSNRAHHRRLGSESPDGVVGKTVFDFLPPERAEKSHNDDRNVLISREPLLNREVRDVSSEGTRWFITSKIPWFDNQNEIRGLVGVSHDITERKLAEDSLRRVARELRWRNDEVEKDLEMARGIQRACLPHQYPPFPPSASDAESQLHFFHRYLPTDTLAGDFFGVFPIADTVAGVFICDVMGHGVRASLITTLMRGLIAERTSGATDPGLFLTELNGALWPIVREPGSTMFVTASYLVIDAANHTIEFSNAGHPSPLHLRRQEGVVELLRPPSGKSQPALGVVEGFEYSNSTATVTDRDLLVLYTDGIFQDSASGPAFNQDELVRVVSNRIDHSCEPLFDELLHEVQEFSGEDDFSDDVCLVGVEVGR